MPNLVFYKDNSGVVNGPLKEEEATALYKANFFRFDHIFKIVDVNSEGFTSIDDLRSLNGADNPFGKSGEENSLDRLNKMSFTDISDIAIMQIMEKLDLRSQFKMRLVSKRMNGLQFQVKNELEKIQFRSVSLVDRELIVQPWDDYPEYLDYSWSDEDSEPELDESEPEPEEREQADLKEPGKKKARKEEDSSSESDKSNDSDLRDRKMNHDSSPELSDSEDSEHEDLDSDDSQYSESIDRIEFGPLSIHSKSEEADMVNGLSRLSLNTHVKKIEIIVKRDRHSERFGHDDTFYKRDIRIINSLLEFNADELEIFSPLNWYNSHFRIPLYLPDLSKATIMSLAQRFKKISIIGVVAPLSVDHLCLIRKAMLEGTCKLESFSVPIHSGQPGEFLKKCFGVNVQWTRNLGPDPNGYLGLRAWDTKKFRTASDSVELYADGFNCRESSLCQIKGDFKTTVRGWTVTFEKCKDGVKLGDEFEKVKMYFDYEFDRQSDESDYYCDEDE